ncbi:MAG: lysophospholipase L1-like esterase [Salibacteraceae bacterium]|jgi:lysophospholipase L1-like esterase
MSIRSKKISRIAVIPVLGILFGVFTQFANVHTEPSFVPTPRLHASEQIESYDFIDYAHNKIEFPGNKLGFESLFDRLDTLVTFGEGNINIMHLGGSHVQAGMLSGRMRDNLFTLADGIKGERGFIFPYRMAHTNNPGNYKATFTGEWDGCRNALKKNHCPWGLSGITATTHDTITTTKLYCVDNNHDTYLFNKVRIYHLATPESFTLALDSSISVDTMYTDSLVGLTTFELSQSYDTLLFKTHKTDRLQEYFVLQGIRLENDDSGLTYNSIGVNGASVPAYLRCQYFQPQLETNAPDMVIFGIGINDAYVPPGQFHQEEYEQNYRDLMNMFRAVNPNVQFLFMTNNDSYYKRRYPNQNVFKVQKAMWNLAEEYNGGYWDLFEIMGGLNSIKIWERKGLAQKDKVHFTRKGYQLNADLLFVAFREAYGDHLADKYYAQDASNQPIQTN